jgi:hypothetical protein
MPRASDRIATIVMNGDLNSVRRARRMLGMSDALTRPVQVWFTKVFVVPHRTAKRANRMMPVGPFALADGPMA